MLRVIPSVVNQCFYFPMFSMNLDQINNELKFSKIYISTRWNASQVSTDFDQIERF